MNIINHILVLFLWLSAPVLHPLHLSVCNIEVDDEKKVMRVTIKVFTDDLENAVLEMYVQLHIYSFGNHQEE